MVDKYNKLSRKVFEEIIKTKDPLRVIEKYPNFFGDGDILRIIYEIEKGLNEYKN